jgi:HK97 family phage major capsid protein
MKNLAELRTRMNAVSTELSTLWQKDERSADDESRIDAILAEMNDLGPQILRAEQVETHIAAGKANGESRGRAAGTLPAAGSEQRSREGRSIDPRTLGRRFADSDQVKDYVTSTGGAHGKSQGFEVKSFYHRNVSDVIHTDDMSPEELRALVYTGALPTDYIRPQIIGGVFRGEDLQATLRSVLINGQTTSDAITFFREASATNNAAPVGQATATNGSSGLKPESGLTLEQATETVKTIATWIPITRQTLWDAPQMETYVNERLLDFLRLEESDQLINGDGTGENFTGILNTTGVQDLDSATYFTGSPVAGAGDANENFNRIRRAARVIRTTGRARANFVVLNPADSEEFDTATNLEGDYYGAGPFSGIAVPRLWGMTVVEDENISAGTALVGDGRMAAVWDRMQAQIMVGYIDDQFVRNMLTILAEERLAFTVFRPAAFAVVELA